MGFVWEISALKNDFYFAFLCHKKDLVVIFLEMEVTAREKKNFN